MKSEKWFDALMAHIRAHADQGTIFSFSMGDAAEVMGCTRTTVRKHMRVACESGRASSHELLIRGSVFERWYEVVV